MNKISCLTLIWFFSMNMQVFAATEKIILDDNKFGGITKSVTYFKKDECHNDGIQKIIYHYDNRGIEKLIEIYATSDYSKKVGSYKTIIYFRKKAKIIEILFTDVKAAQNGYFKMELHFSESNRLKKREYYFTKTSRIAMLGVYKRIIYYDNAGDITEVIHLDKVGNIAMVE